MKVRRFSLTDGEKDLLLRDFYAIAKGHLEIWGLSMAVDQRKSPYFQGRYSTALMKSFPELPLNPLGFKLDWSTEEKSIESVRYVIQRERPNLWERYQRYDSLTDPQKEILLRNFYAVTKSYFEIWGLGGALNKRRMPGFKGSYITALQKSFPKLPLNPLGFYLDWSTEEKGIESVRFVIQRERPELWERYQNYDALTDPQKAILLRDFYAITSGYFFVWGSGGAMIQKNAPYFERSYITALQKSFPELGLEREQFSASSLGKQEPSLEILEVRLKDVRYALEKTPAENHGSRQLFPIYF